MVITENTKISELIKANPACIDAIASINPHFLKLKNPLLRKVLAPRVTIKEAVKIGGASLQDFMKKLSELGFEFVQSVKSFNINTSSSEAANKLDFNVKITVDVREDLENGKDPFMKIMNMLSSLLSNESILLINSFKPIPLIRILESKGFEITTEQVEADLVYTYITKGAQKQSLSQAEESFIVSGTRFNQELKRIKGLIESLDVRNMEMPLPMIAVLERLEGLEDDDALFVHHFKVPHFLLPELTSRGYSYYITEEGPGEIFLLISKEISKVG